MHTHRWAGRILPHTFQKIGLCGFLPHTKAREDAKGRRRKGRKDGEGEGRGGRGLKGPWEVRPNYQQPHLTRGNSLSVSVSVKSADRERSPDCFMVL